ncbi:hypothetical protein B0H10DRAFT_2439264 [Mycena sp. CBHHK59/15]|nr:hypothetical protein B0H10DRAFT_2439264 [Mycena sp. CBHHK59/15]
MHSVAFPDSPLSMVNPYIDSPPPPDQATELFRMRKVFLDHGWQYGLSVTPEKWEAISRGDMSGLIVDPALVTVCQLMGYHLSTHAHREAWIYSKGQTEAEGGQGVALLDLLEGITGASPDPVTRLQAYTFLAVYWAQKDNFFASQEFLRRAGDAATQSCVALDDIPPSNLLLDSVAWYFSPQNTAQEARAAFSHLIFVDVAGRIIFNLPSMIDPGLLSNFRRLAAVHSTDTELNFIRAKCVIYLADSLKLAHEFGLDAPRDWSARYWTLVEDVHAQLNIINTPSTEALVRELKVLRPSLVTCIIMALAALAKLYGLFAPFQPESRRKHREVVDEIARITASFHPEDYQYLEPTLGAPRFACLLRRDKFLKTRLSPVFRNGILSP